MPRRVLEGQVVSDKMDKTVTVLVERRYMHSLYKKYLKKTGKFTAHDEHNSFKVGDRVQIEECKPISKRKTWRVITTPEGGTPAAKDEKKTSAKKPAAKKDAEKKTAAKKDETKETAKKAAPKKAAAKKDDKKADTKKKPAAKKTAAKKDTKSSAKKTTAAKKKTATKKKDDKK